MCNATMPYVVIVVLVIVVVVVDDMMMMMVIMMFNDIKTAPVCGPITVAHPEF